MESWPEMGKHELSATNHKCCIMRRCILNIFAALSAVLMVPVFVLWIHSVSHFPFWIIGDSSFLEIDSFEGTIGLLMNDN